MWALAALKLILLTGPDGHQEIEVNPAEITSFRTPRASEHFARGVHCLIFTADARFVAVHETCHEVQRRLDGGD